LDGIETCRRLKADARTRDVPVIFMSALDDLRDKTSGFEAGAVDYITKPFQVQEVALRVRTHLTLRRLQQQLEDEYARFRGLSEATCEGIFIHRQGRIVEANAAAERLTGYLRAELLEQDFFDLLLPPDARELVRHAAAGMPVEVRLLRKQGANMPVEIQTNQIAYRSDASGVLAMRDITWRKTLEQENLALKTSLSDRDHFGELVGKTPPMKKVYELIVKAAASPETVIIYGETGTGKELVARTIFEVGAQHTRAFVTVHCGAIQENLFESQFFGYRKGAFTGAERDMPGYFDQAHGGTLFLDEARRFFSSPACVSDSSAAAAPA